MLNFGGLDGLNFYANILQIASYQELLNQANNDDIMTELQHQNKAYLETIIKNQVEIIKRLILDEEIHLKILTNIQNELNFQNFDIDNN